MTPYQCRTVLLVMTSMMLLSGCTTIEPWERNNLAKSQMAAEPNPLHAAFREHTFFSREGTSGGDGGSGGGCGCN